MSTKIIGALLLVGGIAVGLFGVSYVNSPQYKVMSVVNSMTGGNDPTGNVAMGIGGLVTLIGLCILLAAPKKQTKGEPNE